MLLTMPTIEQLKDLELPELLDWLTKYTAHYCRLIRNEGFTEESESYKQIVRNIQKSIEAKK